MHVRIIIGTDQDDLNAKLEAAAPFPADTKVHFGVTTGQFGTTYFVFLSTR